MKQLFSRTNAVLEERSKSLEDRENELENLNHILSRLQIDYERSKTDLSVAHDKLVQHEISNQTLQQHLTEKSNEVNRQKHIRCSTHLDSFRLVICHHCSTSSVSTRSSCL